MCFFYSTSKVIHPTPYIRIVFCKKHSLDMIVINTYVAAVIYKFASATHHYLSILPYVDEGVLRSGCHSPCVDPAKEIVFIVHICVIKKASLY